MTQVATSTTSFEDYCEGLKDDLVLEARAQRDLIEEILHLKVTRNVLILGHNYMSPLIYRLADPGCRGDSLGLSLVAARSEQPVILFNGVYFMAETAKILNPEKTVLIADREAGCSLADPISAADVRGLKKRYPGLPVVTYINSYADIKAESDLCCTSANAMDVILATGAPRVIFLPDSLMGANLQDEFRRQGLDIELIYPGPAHGTREGKCEVHDQITVADVRAIRKQFDIPRGHPNRAVLVHWECRPDVVAEADFTGSTSGMARYIRDRKPEKVFLGTECEMAANLESEFPETEFARLCNVFCKHMALISLTGIRDALTTMAPPYVIEIDEDLRRRALGPIQRMLDLPGR
jgi:quinolinate synthase